MPFFSYHIPSFSFPGVPRENLFDHVAELARSAESAGFEQVTVMDHFYQIANVGTEDEPMLEGYTALAGLARETRKVRLGTMVTGVTYRNPALVAKMVTTLDILSKGRAICGIGAAWNESEHLGYGYDFPPIRERMDRLEEALTIIKLMFTQERPSFTGTHYRIDRALNSPRPLQPGGPKILVGGGGEKRTLRLVARYADMSHWFGSLADIKRKSEILDRYCDEEGRDPATITRTMGSPVVLVEDEGQAKAVMERMPPERRTAFQPATPEQAAEILEDYKEIGIQGFTFNNPTLNTPEEFDRLERLLTAVKGRQPVRS
ncbi:MAG TPA: TIGR03560 family F420-dependent LLM class oxidoreductase [Candidatus Dormibacteraeota bacterium]|nr:TIGR03560 family F420-dependent LLM class oxidoreductase [Candidatus Dormibacteraeota bacterium]